MSDPIDPQFVFNSFLALLRTQLNGQSDNSGSGAKVWDYEAPPTAAYPYFVVYHVAGGKWSGPALRDPEADLAVVLQVDTVGTRRDQVQLMSTKLARVVVGRETNGSLHYALPSLPANLREQGRMPADTPGGVDMTPPAAPGSTRIYSAPSRWQIDLTQV